MKKAMIDAGYSETYADRNSKYLLGIIGEQIKEQQNLTKLDIQNYIQKRLEEKDNELIAKQDEVLKYLTSVMKRKHKDKAAEINRCPLYLYSVVLICCYVILFKIFPYIVK